MRFSLRFLFVVITALCVACAFPGYALAMSGLLLPGLIGSLLVCVIVIVADRVGRKEQRDFRWEIWDVRSGDGIETRRHDEHDAGT